MIYMIICTRGITRLSYSIIWVKYRIMYVRGYVWVWQGMPGCLFLSDAL